MIYTCVYIYIYIRRWHFRDIFNFFNLGQGPIGPLGPFGPGTHWAHSFGPGSHWPIGPIHLGQGPIGPLGPFIWARDPLAHWAQLIFQDVVF